jgi:hypothetical protein
MAFDWLNRFHQQMEKDANYADKALAAYRLGIKGKGSIVGVVIECAADCCEAARNLPAGRVYDPSEAPRLPLAGCPRGRHCGCVYRPIMSYQKPRE